MYKNYRVVKRIEKITTMDEYLIKRYAKLC